MTPAEWLEAQFDAEHQRRPRLGGAGRRMLTLKDDTSGFEQFSSSARWPEPHPFNRIREPENPA